MSGGVMGFDLSLNSTGVADTDGMLRLIRPPKDASTDVVKRRAIADEVHRFAWHAEPDLIVIESVPSRGARGIVPLARLHGVVLDQLDDRWPVLWVTPEQRAGFATGNPKAAKPLVIQAAVAEGAPIPDSPKAGRDDLADAAVLRWIGLATLGHWVVDRKPHRANLVDRLTGAAA